MRWTPTLLCAPKSSEPVPKILLAPFHSGPPVSVILEPFPRTKEAHPEQRGKAQKQEAGPPVSYPSSAAVGLGLARPLSGISLPSPTMSIWHSFVLRSIPGCVLSRCAASRNPSRAGLGLLHPCFLECWFLLSLENYLPFKIQLRCHF